MIAFDPQLTLISSASAVARKMPDGSFRACVIRGRPGAGKSTLAINVVALGAMLVSDDVVAASNNGELTVHAPNQPFSGLIDLREAGFLRLPHVDRGRLSFIVDVTPWHGAPDPMRRAPSPGMMEILGRSIPRYRIMSSPASAAVVWSLLGGGEIVDPDNI